MRRKVVRAAVVIALLCGGTSAAQPAKAPAPARPAASAKPTAAPSGAPTAAPSTTAAPTASVTEPPAPSTTTTAAPATTAEPEDAAAAFALGREAYKANDLERALVLFNKSYTLEATPGTLLNIALTEEKLGRTATALHRFERVVALLKPDDDRAPIAREGVDRTSLRAPRLKIDRAAGAPPTLAITLDGAPLAANLVGAEQALDPGPHVITTSVVGFEPRRYDVTLAEGQRLSLTVEPGKRELVVAPVVTVEKPASSNAGRLASFTLGGVGLAGLGVGLVTGLMAVAKKDELAAACVGSPQCDASRQRIEGAGRAFADVTTGSLILGGITLAAGVVTLMTVGDGKRLFVSASAGPDGGALVAKGRF